MMVRPHVSFVGGSWFVRGLCSLMAACSLASSAAMAAEARIEKLEPRIWSCEFTSAALGRAMRFVVVLPDGVTDKSVTPVPVIYMLHGRGRNETTLLNDPFSRRNLLASGCAIVLPRGEDGWYMDSPVLPTDRYAAYLDEVIALAEARFPVRRDGAGRAVTGWSMGGYGAAYTFVRRPGAFAALATIIGIVDYPRASIEPASLNYPVQTRFGNDPAVWRTVNPRALLAGVARRPMMVAYADRAAERQMNEVFIATARKLGFAVTEMRIPGGHVFRVVREALPAVLGFLELQLIPPPGANAPAARKAP